MRKVKLTYLRENETGSIISCSLKYDTFDRLFVATLDKDRNLSDYRALKNGHPDIQARDTISQLVFGSKDEVIVEELHMSMDDEPEFEIDGIRKYEFVVTKDLRLQEK